MDGEGRDHQRDPSQPGTTLPAAVHAGSWMDGVEMLNDQEGTEDACMQRIGQGSGLLGLWERVSGLGGMVKAGPLLLEGEPHFRLCVELPMRPQVEVMARPEERS